MDMENTIKKQETIFKDSGKEVLAKQLPSLKLSPTAEVIKSSSNYFPEFGYLIKLK